MKNTRDRHSPDSAAEDLGRQIDTLSQPGNRPWLTSSGDRPATRLDLAGTDAHVAGLRPAFTGRTASSMHLAWPLAACWIHDAMIEDLRDTAEAELGSPLPGRQRSRWVKLLLYAGPTPEEEE